MDASGRSANARGVRCALLTGRLVFSEESMCCLPSIQSGVLFPSALSPSLSPALPHILSLPLLSLSLHRFLPLLLPTTSSLFLCLNLPLPTHHFSSTSTLLAAGQAMSGAGLASQKHTKAQNKHTKAQNILTLCTKRCVCSAMSASDLA
eukprot:1382177-Rhodomonas_salina.1